MNASYVSYEFSLFIQMYVNISERMTVAEDLKGQDSSW